MRVPVVLLAFAAILLAGSRHAAAEDAGDDGSVDAGTAQPSSGDAAAVDAASEPSDLGLDDDGAAIAVIACDGALCDTTQGRPTCAVSPPSRGHTGVDPTVLAGIFSVLALGLARRANRGT